MALRSSAFISGRRMLFVVLVTTTCAACTGGNAADPTPTTLSAAETRDLGWDLAGLDAAVEHARSLGTDALVIVTDGTVVRSMGDVTKRRSVHSVRKALLSAIVGQHVGPGARQIDLDATLADLDIDDAPVPLTPLQREATVLHLIKSVSGINHAAAAEAGMAREKNRRLGRGENQPGTIWAYSNWDYNALTTIFETRTGLSVAEAFEAGIANRIGMRDFSTWSVSYSRRPRASRHRAAMFKMSARDLVRFGELYLSNGSWQGEQVLPEAWVARVVADYTSTGDGGLRAGHGYLWWIPDADTGLPPGTFWAVGFGRQAVFVIPAWRTVIVHQADTTEFWKRTGRLAKAENIGLDAALERVALQCLRQPELDPEFCKNDRLILRREFSRLIELIVQARAS